MRGVSQKFFKSSDGSNTPAVQVGAELAGGATTGFGVVSMLLPPPQPASVRPESAAIIASDALLFLNIQNYFL